MVIIINIFKSKNASIAFCGEGTVAISGEVTGLFGKN